MDKSTINAINRIFGSMLIEQEIKIQMLMELSVETGLVNEEELNEKYRTVRDRDFYKLSSELTDKINKFF